jgi:hypothetical protein
VSVGIASVTLRVYVIRRLTNLHRQVLAKWMAWCFGGTSIGDKERGGVGDMMDEEGSEETSKKKRKGI